MNDTQEQKLLTEAVKLYDRLRERGVRRGRLLHDLKRRIQRRLIAWRLADRVRREKMERLLRQYGLKCL